MIQTYQPEHYSIKTAKDQDYEAFYRQEIEYRKMMLYPPVFHLLVILCASKWEQRASDGADELLHEIDGIQELKKKIFPIGPADPAIARINDIYRKVIYLKAEDYQNLVFVKDRLEKFVRDNTDYKDIVVQFDFNPVNGF